MFSTNASAIEAVIEALTELGHVESVDAALITACRMLARAVDDKPDNASLWKQYLEALRDLSALSEALDDDFSNLLASLQHTEDNEP